MEIRVQPVTADFFSVEIAVCAVYDSADLLFGSDVSHNGEDLSCKHHANLIREKSFHCTAMIIVIAVKPPFIRSSVDPFVILEMSREPVGLALQIFRQLGQADGNASAADPVPAALGITCE